MEKGEKIVEREMTNEEAIEILEDIRAYYDIFYEYEEPTYVALSKAIFALNTKPKYAYVVFDEDGNIKCSNCGSGNCFGNYCGHCGAKLVGKRKDGVEE